MHLLKGGHWGSTEYARLTEVAVHSDMRDTMGVIDQGTTRSSMDAGGQDPFEEITNKFNDSNFKPENALYLSTVI